MSLRIALIPGSYVLLSRVGPEVWEELWSFPFSGPFSQTLAFREAVRSALVYNTLCGGKHV